MYDRNRQDGKIGLTSKQTDDPIYLEAFPPNMFLLKNYCFLNKHNKKESLLL